MFTYALMLVLVLCIVATTIFGVKIDKNKDSFMSISDTTFLRGFWCIIVILVHIPTAYHNLLQNIIGSFAYIGVTFFFMTSAYGLKYSMIHKKGYMEHFWKRRLPSILIPALIANAFEVIMYGLENDFMDFSVISFININGWVKVLLLYYVVFWLIYYIAPKLIGSGYWQDIVMCLYVAICSLTGRLTELKITSIWIVEPLGFAYGIIVADCSDKIRQWMKEKWLLKCGILMAISLVLGTAYLKMKPIAFIGDYLLKILLGITITVFIFQVISELKVGNKVNGFLGGISYEVYLLHHGVFAALATVSYNMNSGVFVILSVVFTVVLAYMLNKICRPIVGLVM